MFRQLGGRTVTEGTSNIRIAPLAFSMKAILVVGILMRSTRLCWSVILVCALASPAFPAIRPGFGFVPGTIVRPMEE